MFPTLRLILLFFALGVPGAVAGPLFPSARIAAVAAITAVVILGFIDALLRERALAGIRIELPDLVRLVQDRATTVRVRIHNPAARAFQLRIGLMPPDGIEADWEDQQVVLPSGAAAADISWSCTPRRRGRYRINTCYLEASSPLGLWAVRRQDPVPLELR